MVDLDLDIVTKSNKTVKLNGKEIHFKDITMEEHMEAELTVQTLEAAPIANEESIKDILALKDKYLMIILDITKADAKKIKMDQYKALRKFIARQEMYDQGYSDRDIDAIEKKALKKQMAQLP